MTYSLEQSSGGQFYSVFSPSAAWKSQKSPEQLGMTASLDQLNPVLLCWINRVTGGRQGGTR